MYEAPNIPDAPAADRPDAEDTPPSMSTHQSKPSVQEGPGLDSAGSVSSQLDTLTVDSFPSVVEQHANLRPKDPPPKVLSGQLDLGEPKKRRRGRFW
jgi:hypothetical protein